MIPCWLILPRTRGCPMHVLVPHPAHFSGRCLWCLQKSQRFVHPLNHTPSSHCAPGAALGPGCSGDSQSLSPESLVLFVPFLLPDHENTPLCRLLALPGRPRCTFESRVSLALILEAGAQGTFPSWQWPAVQHRLPRSPLFPHGRARPPCLKSRVLADEGQFLGSLFCPTC